MAVITNTTVPADLEPAISIDHSSRLVENIKTLQAVLGVAEMTPMASGTLIKQYKMVSGTIAAQVNPGDEIGLTKVSRELANTFEIILKKYRKLTPAEDIQKVGHDVAINKTDDKLVSEIRKGVKADFFTALGTGTGTATGSNLQTACANLWAKLQTRYEDMDVTPIFFVNPQDVADYLGTANITMQTAFGLSYIENFLGMGNAIVTSAVAAKSPVATVTENMNGAYVPASGDVASDFGLTVDESGLIGMCHNIVSDRASIDTLIFSGVVFYPEEVDGVFTATIAAA